MNDNTRLDLFEALVMPIVSDHLYAPDLQALRAVHAAIAAHGLRQGPPVWPMIVAPPGSAKTTALEPLEGLVLAGSTCVYPIDRLTPATFLSGQIQREGEAGRRPSLLHRIGPSGIITFPDFSTILSLKPDDKAAILADLRRIYDGHLTKEVGTSGEPLEWRGRITLAAACTPALDAHFGVFASLGERFVLIRWHRPGGADQGCDAALSAMRQDPEALRHALADAAEILFDDLPDQDVDVSDAHQQQIAALAEFCVHARTHVARDGRTKDLLYEPEAEAPTRLAQQLIQLARGSARLGRRARVADVDLTMVRRVAGDCIPRLRWRVLSAYIAGTQLVTEIPSTTLHYCREDLRLVGLLDRKGLSPLARRLLAASGLSVSNSRLIPIARGKGIGRQRGHHRGGGISSEVENAPEGSGA